MEMFPQLKEMTPESEHIATFGITEKRFKAGDYDNELTDFISQLK